MVTHQERPIGTRELASKQAIVMLSNAPQGFQQECVDDACVLPVARVKVLVLRQLGPFTLAQPSHSIRLGCACNFGGNANATTVNASAAGNNATTMAKKNTATTTCNIITSTSRNCSRSQQQFLLGLEDGGMPVRLASGPSHRGVLIVALAHVLVERRQQPRGEEERRATRQSAVDQRWQAARARTHNARGGRLSSRRQLEVVVAVEEEKEDEGGGRTRTRRRRRRRKRGMGGV
jgi:hypothetical protein